MVSLTSELDTCKFRISGFLVLLVSLTPELDTCKFKISGFLMLLVKLLRCQVIQR